MESEAPENIAEEADEKIQGNFDQEEPGIEDDQDHGNTENQTNPRASEETVNNSEDENPVDEDQPTEDEPDSASVEQEVVNTSASEVEILTTTILRVRANEARSAGNNTGALAAWGILDRLAPGVVKGMEERDWRENGNPISLIKDGVTYYIVRVDEVTADASQNRDLDQFVCAVSTSSDSTSSVHGDRLSFSRQEIRNGQLRAEHEAIANELSSGHEKNIIAAQGKLLKDGTQPENLDNDIQAVAQEFGILTTQDIEQCFQNLEAGGDLSQDAVEQIRLAREALSGHNIPPQEVINTVLNLTGVSENQINQTVNQIQTELENQKQILNNEKDPATRALIGRKIVGLEGSLRLYERFSNGRNAINDYFENMSKGTQDLEKGRAFCEAIRTADPIKILEILVPGDPNDPEVAEKRRNYKEMMDKGTGFILLAALLAFSEGVSAVSRSGVV